MLAALAGAACSAPAAPSCLAAGEPIHWAADYCMLAGQTDDEIAVSDCVERERTRRFPDACASNMHFKRRMCESMIRAGSRAGSVAQCLADPGFRGRTVEAGGVGG